MKCILIIVTLAFFTHISEGTQQIVKDKITPAQISLPVEKVKIEGFLGERLNKNIENRLLPFDIEGFLRMLEARNYRDWFWIGEQPGKWLEAAILSSEYSGNSKLREKAEAALKRMLAAQSDDGYLGITSREVMTAKKPFRGMDPYELYFTFHALLTAYEEWGIEEALTGAKNLGNFFLSKTGPGKAEFYPFPDPVTISGHAVHYSLEGTLLCDPMMRLYRITGEKRYLDWVQWAVGNIDKWSNCDSFSNLDKVASNEIGIHQIQPYVHAHTLHMNMLGFLQLYQVTGDASYLRKVEGAWKDISERQTYITGGVSVGEHYEAGHNLPNSGMVVETCATMSWLILCQRLLEITGNPKYADAIEILMWNHLPAAQSWDGDGFRYHTPLVGWKPEKTFTGHDCCSSSGPRILSIIPSFFYAGNKNEIFINQYGQSSCEVVLGNETKIEIKQQTGYPSDGKIIIHIGTEKPARFALKLRIPRWCRNPSVSLNGVAIKLTSKAGSYEIIEREWRNGDKIELLFPDEARWIKGEYTNEGLVALVKMPLIFYFDSVWLDETIRALIAQSGEEHNPLKDIKGINISHAGNDSELKQVTIPEGAIGPAYAIEIVLSDGKKIEAIMLPFANLGKWYRNDEDKKDRHARLFPYGVWMPLFK